jgi:hypothetical protein
MKCNFSKWVLIIFLIFIKNAYADLFPPPYHLVDNKELVPEIHQLSGDSSSPRSTPSIGKLLPKNRGGLLQNTKKTVALIPNVDKLTKRIEELEVLVKEQQKLIELYKEELAKNKTTQKEE